jgi:predicted small integral membrane protein
LTHLFACLIIVGGLAAWLSLAVVNNICDGGTNITLLGRMMRMTELKCDCELGIGLRHRAIGDFSTFPRVALTLVIIIQVAIAMALWAGFVYLALALAGGDAQRAIDVASLAITAFAGLWFAFLIGGLWFGYWIKMPQVQQVHLTLLMISTATLVLLHLK